MAGAYFSNVGWYNFVDIRETTFLTSYTLTGLENALSNAKEDPTLRLLNETESLEYNLNEIYKICLKNRANYLPYGSLSISESQLKSKLDEALSDSVDILADLVSLSSHNFTDKFGVKEKMTATKYRQYNYLYPTYVKDYEVAKKYINFAFALERISKNGAVVTVKMAVPILVEAQLHRINYVQRQIPNSEAFESIKDQSVDSIAVSNEFYNYRINSDYEGFYLIKNIDNCELFNESFLCDAASITKVQNKEDSCTTLLFKSNCDFDKGYSCDNIDEKCIYEESTFSYKEFTYLGDNRFYALLTREANYKYECEDGRKEEGKLIFETFGDHRYTGNIEIEENCNLITAHTSIFNKNGVYDIKEIDNEDLIWADVPKIIGIPISIFALSVAVALLIVLILLFTWMFICVKRCKTKKANLYSNVNGSG